MIDIQTLLFALGIGNFCFAVLMGVYTGGRDRRTGLRPWMWARVVMGGTQLLGCAYAAPGNEWVHALEPLGWIAGMALESIAYCNFFEFRRGRRMLLPISGLLLLLAVAAREAGASRGDMTVLVTAIIALYGAAMGNILLRAAPRGTSVLQKIIGVNDLLFAAAIGAWAAMGYLRGGDSMLHPSPLQGIAFVSGYVVMIVNGFGFLLLCKQKDDAQMERLATTDFLTGMLNRRAFFERAEGARMLAGRLRKPIALLMLDIDHFKQINDRFGHASGDEALVVFAHTARRMLREPDIMGRLGGEEFALALPGTDHDGALQAAERLRVAVTEAPIITSGSSYAMTVSVGVVLIEPHEPLAIALARADHALYAAKSGGRNRVEAGAPALRRA